MVEIRTYKRVAEVVEGIKWVLCMVEMQAI